MARARRPAGNPSRESHNRLHVEYNLERPPIHGEVPGDEGWQSWFRGGGVNSATRAVALLALGGVVVVGILSVAFVIEPATDLLSGRSFDTPEQSGVTIELPEEDQIPPDAATTRPAENVTPEKQTVPTSSEPEKSPEQQVAAPESPEAAAEAKPEVAAQPTEETPAPENP